MTSHCLSARACRAVLALGIAGAVSACATPHADPYAYAPPPPPPVAAPPAAQPPAPPPPVAQAKPRPPAERQVAVGGTAFPVDGTEGLVPPGSRLVVRVYDAAGGDVNVRVAESAFRLAEGIPVRYRLPVPASAMDDMDLPAVAARVETAKGGVVYRNETAVLLRPDAPGDIPMTRQRKQAASAVTREWTSPETE